MKISDLDPSQATRVQSKKAAGRASSVDKGGGSTASAGSPTASSDSVNISAAGSQLRTFRTAYAGASNDIRTEKLQSLQTAIASGNYHPDPAEVADALVRFVQGQFA